MSKNMNGFSVPFFVRLFSIATNCDLGLQKLVAIASAKVHISYENSKK